MSKTKAERAIEGQKYEAQESVGGCEDSTQWESLSHSSAKPDALGGLDEAEQAAVAALLFRKGLLLKEEGSGS